MKRTQINTANAQTLNDTSQHYSQENQEKSLPRKRTRIDRIHHQSMDKRISPEKKGSGNVTDMSKYFELPSKASPTIREEYAERYSDNDVQSYTESEAHVEDVL